MSDRKLIHQENLEKIFNPTSVALIGVTKKEGTVPHDILKSMVYGGFKGVIYPVSPGSKHLLGYKSYKYVIDIPDPVDLGIIVFPSTVCHMALEQCIQKDIKSIIIISAGFKEIGERGLEREKQLVKMAEENGISFIGPNCLGMINTDPNIQINASFARSMPADGNIAFLSQSGALCTAVLDYATAKGIGFSKFVSFGNKADISEIDMMTYLKDDPKSSVILLYLEEVTDGRALMKAADDVIRNTQKPVLIIKSGRTQEGASAAASHTGSLAGSDEICDAGFKQAGIIRCEHIQEMFNLAIAFDYQPIPVGNRVAIITNAGGPGVLLTDALIKEGMQLARFSEETTKILKKALPNTANIKNPVDVIGDATADRYHAALRPIFEDPGVDAVMVILTPQSMTDIVKIANELVAVGRDYQKPLYASFMGETDVADGVQILQDAQIPHYALPEEMSRTFANVFRFGSRLKSIKDLKLFPTTGSVNEVVTKIVETARNQGKSHLPEYQAATILRAYGLPALEGSLAPDQEQAVVIANRIGYPVVMKIQAESIIHKVDVGGVKLNLQSPEQVELSFVEMMKGLNKNNGSQDIEGVYITKQIPKGVEVILGVKQDPSFGPVIMFGLGGIHVEVFQDVSFRIAPVDEMEAMEMIKEIRAFPLLTGIRGSNPKDIKAVVDAIVKLSQLALQHPEIQEIDINPLIVQDQEKGCFIADAKMII